MTRINVVPVEELHDKHLTGEYHEITRVFGLVRKAQEAGRTPAIPESYRMGKGHVLFFYDKLGFIAARYYRLAGEMRRRGYNPQPLMPKELCEGIDERWMGIYTPTEEALAISRQRIKEMMPQ